MHTPEWTIKTVAERTGISIYTLRAWERRYGVPSPGRDENNRYRLYKEADIANVLFMKQQIEAGVAPAQASLLVRLRQDQSVRTSTVREGLPLEAVQAALLEALAKSDETAARRVLDEAFALFAPEQVALEIIEPTMSEIGERWMHGEMTVWQEHLASNVIQQKLDAVLQAQPALTPTAPLLAAACAPSEAHQLGLVILTLLARRQGWRVAYLGQGTPLDDMVDLARVRKPNAIAVSVTTVVGLTGLIPWLDPAKRPAPPLIFGGRLPNLLPGLRSHLPGEYVGDNALAAVRNLPAIQPRAEYWSPSRRALSAAKTLEAKRLKIAGDVAAQFTPALPKAGGALGGTQVNYATLFLIDSLACALAFGAADLMDAQWQWLAEAMPPRSITPSLLARHRQVFASTLNKTLEKEHVRLVEPLVERMMDQR